MAQTLPRSPNGVVFKSIFSIAYLFQGAIFGVVLVLLASEQSLPEILMSNSTLMMGNEYTFHTMLFLSVFLFMTIRKLLDYSIYVPTFKCYQREWGQLSGALTLLNVSFWIMAIDSVDGIAAVTASFTSIVAVSYAILYPFKLWLRKRYEDPYEEAEKIRHEKKMADNLLKMRNNALDMISEIRTVYANCIDSSFDDYLATLIPKVNTLKDRHKLENITTHLRAIIQGFEGKRYLVDFKFPE